MIEKRVQLLDATIRDGGLGLEDEFVNHFNDATFSMPLITQMASLLVKTGMDIVEIGSIHPSIEDKSLFSKFNCIEDISQLIPNHENSKQLYVGMFVGPDTPCDKIPKRTEILLDGVRVILRYSELQKSLDFCKQLAEKGYKVFIQPMVTMRYSEKELAALTECANNISAYALYFVDSYGYMQSSDVKRFFDFYDSRLNQDIRIGFHAHNNLDLAFSNVQTFLEIPSSRKIIIDSCVTGMGQGAGNLQTELIVPFVNKKYNGEYDFQSVLDLCELIDNAFPFNSIWGYSVFRALPAIHKTAYKYAVVYRKKYGLKYSQINELLQMMPDEFRHRYTPEDAEKVYQLYNNR